MATVTTYIFGLRDADGRLQELTRERAADLHADLGRWLAETSEKRTPAERMMEEHERTELLRSFTVRELQKLKELAK